MSFSLATEKARGTKIKDRGCCGSAGLLERLQVREGLKTNF